MKATVRALQVGDYDDALACLLAEWEITRAPELAELIDEVSSRVTATLDALDAKEQRKSLMAWVELVRGKRPSDVDRLLAALRHVLAAGPAHVVVPRLDELLLLPPDPRVASALVAAVAGPLGGWNRAVSVRAVKALLRHGDAQLAPSFKAALDARKARLVAGSWAERHHERGNDGRFASVLEAWSKRTASAPPAGIDEVRQALSTAPAPIAARDRKPVRHRESLLAAIYADPSDDALRLVYADQLSDSGDPRGELIMLQLDRAAGRGSAAARRRSSRRTGGRGSARSAPRS
jgi:uncharacterized protein (TIGR02996 family)